MTLKKLALSLVILLVLIGAIWARMATRQTQIEAAFPPIGQFITVNGAQVHYKTSGQGPDIVLIHGASGNLREWEFGLRAALETSFRVTAFDRPGHGYSDAIKGGDHLAAQAQQLRAAAQLLGIKTPILVGHSYGGSVSLAWSLIEKPRALVLISAPSLPWPGKLDPWYRVNNFALTRTILAPVVASFVPQSYVQAATRAVFAPQTAPQDYLENYGAMLAARAPSLRTNVAQVNALLDDIRGQMAGYPTLDMPVELIHGDSDIIVPLEIHAQKLVDILPGARLTVLHGTGHMPQHQNSAAVLSAIMRLLP